MRTRESTNQDTQNRLNLVNIFIFARKHSYTLKDFSGSADNRSMTYNLERKTESISMFGNDTENVTLNVTQITNNIVRLKVYINCVIISPKIGSYSNF